MDIMQKLFPKWLIAYLFVLWPIVIFCLITLMTGKACISYKGFAIDGDSNIYLAKDGVIDVLNPQGEILRTISPYTTRDYKFTLTSDNTIRICTGDYIYQTDLSGNLISKKELSDSTLDERIEMSRHKYVASNGTVYTMKNSLLRTYIYRMDGAQRTVVYQMPIFDYVVKVLAIVSFLSFIIVVPICIITSRKSVPT